MRIKLPPGEVLQCWEKVGLRERKKRHHPANYLVFSTAAVSYRSQMKKWENEVYFWSLLVTF